MSTENPEKLLITLTKGDVKQSTNGLGLHAFPIFIQAFSNINLENNEAIADANGLYPANIFVYQKNGTGLDPNQGDRFMKVATAVDLDSLPAYDVEVEDNLPLTSINGYPFFRYNELKLFVDYPDELDDLWGYIKEDVSSLANEYNSLVDLTANAETFTTTTTSTIGD
jgi:hypothetical protein